MNRTAIIDELVAKGYSRSSLEAATDQELMSWANYENEVTRDNRQDDRNRAVTNWDFKNNLAQLTSSKQRQAEQAGRINQGVERTRGLASMMSNF